jgi:hypothetical protein
LSKGATLQDLHPSTSSGCSFIFPQEPTRPQTYMHLPGFRSGSINSI